MIGVVARREWQALFRAPFAWFVLAAAQFLIGWQFLAQLELFQQALPRLRQLAEPPGVTQLVLYPTFQISAFLVLFLAPILTMQSLSGERRQGTLSLWYSAPVSLPALIAGKYLGVMAVLGVIWLINVLLTGMLFFGTALDAGMAAGGLLALALLMSACTALGLWTSALTSQPAIAAIGSFALLLALWLVDWDPGEEASSRILASLSLLAHFQRPARGFLHVFDLAYFVLLSLLGLLLASRALAAEQRRPTAGRLAATAALAWLLVALGVGASRLPFSVDVTASARHTLAPASVEAITRLPGPMTITAYLAPGHNALAYLRELVARYQRHRPDLGFAVVDPASVPDRMRRDQLMEGMVVIASDGREERFTRYSEEAMTRALLKLARGEPEWVAFLTGHGERSPERRANFDLGQWGEVLRGRGYRLQELNLATIGAVPDNTGLLVLASPLLELLPQEMAALETYLARGGRLLWLMEADAPPGLNRLGALLGVAASGKVVLDPAGEAAGVRDPSLVVITRYPDHPVTRALRGMSLLPISTDLTLTAMGGWQWQPVLETGAQAWLAARPPGPEEIPVSDPHTRGRKLLAATLTRAHDAGEQRVAVVGDGDFLSNTYLGNGANQDLGTHLVDWLTANDALVGIGTRLTPDLELRFGPVARGALGLGVLVGLPLAFAAAGAWLGFRRRRA